MTPSSTRTPELIRADLERTRQATEESLDQVRRELRAATDWREWVRRHPGTCLTIAAALGFGLGLAGGRFRSSPPHQDPGGPHGDAE